MVDPRRQNRAILMHDDVKKFLCYCRLHQWWIQTMGRGACFACPAGFPSSFLPQMRGAARPPGPLPYIRHCSWHLVVLL